MYLLVCCLPEDKQGIIANIDNYRQAYITSGTVNAGHLGLL